MDIESINPGIDPSIQGPNSNPFAVHPDELWRVGQLGGIDERGLNRTSEAAVTQSEKKLLQGPRGW